MAWGQTSYHCSPWRRGVWGYPVPTGNRWMSEWLAVLAVKGRQTQILLIRTPYSDLHRNVSRNHYICQLCSSWLTFLLRSSNQFGMHVWKWVAMPASEIYVCAWNALSVLTCLSALGAISSWSSSLSWAKSSSFKMSKYVSASFTSGFWTNLHPFRMAGRRGDLNPCTLRSPQDWNVAYKQTKKWQTI